MKNPCNDPQAVLAISEFTKASIEKRPAEQWAIDIIGNCFTQYQKDRELYLKDYEQYQKDRELYLQYHGYPPKEVSLDKIMGLKRGRGRPKGPARKPSEERHLTECVQADYPFGDNNIVTLSELAHFSARCLHPDDYQKSSRNPVFKRIYKELERAGKEQQFVCKKKDRNLYVDLERFAQWTTDIKKWSNLLSGLNNKPAWLSEIYYDGLRETLQLWSLEGNVLGTLPPENQWADSYIKLQKDNLALEKRYHDLTEEIQRLLTENNQLKDRVQRLKHTTHKLRR